MIAGGLAGAAAGFSAGEFGGMDTGVRLTGIEDMITKCTASLAGGTVFGAGALGGIGYFALIVSALNPVGLATYSLVAAGTLVGASAGFVFGANFGCG